MQTVSVNVCSYCVPCQCHCRHCLLSYDGHVQGLNYEESAAFAQRMQAHIKASRPEASFLFYFGYSMEHPHLMDVLDDYNRQGFVTGQFLQLNGLRMRDDAALDAWMQEIALHGVKKIDCTFYGLEETHNRFAGRAGDFDYLLRILRSAHSHGIGSEVGVMLTRENADQVDPLLALLEDCGVEHCFLVVPHIEGRGLGLNTIRFSAPDYEKLGEKARSRFNPRVYKTEAQWVAKQKFTVYSRRSIALVLAAADASFWAQADCEEAIRAIEEKDDAYHAALPSLPELIALYGNPAGNGYFSQRDLEMNYQRRFIQEHGLQLYDIHDERHSFVRRF